MAKCEEGYLCDVCGQDVEDILQSELYLRFVIGWVDPETLHTAQERHLKRNPSLAQFIVDPRFSPVVVTGDFDKRQMDAAWVQQRERLVTRGWQRLRELKSLNPPIHEYPLEDVRSKWTGDT